MARTWVNKKESLSFDPPKISLEEGVPIPSVRFKIRDDWEQIFVRMDPGKHSFVCSEREASSAWQYSKKHGFKIIRRRAGFKLYRIWKM